MRTFQLLLLSLLVAASVSGTGSGADAVSTPPKLLYTSDWSGTHQVYAVDPSGRAPRGQVTFGRAPACGPDIPCGFLRPTPSPDGTRIAFSDYSVQGPASRGLFLARADGAKRRRVAAVRGFPSIAAAWSPDSRRLAYGADEGIWLVDARGSRARPVVRTERPYDLAWSPSGAWLAYMTGDLHVVRPDGRGKRTLVDGWVQSFSWSPSGRLLAFAPSGGGVGVVDVRTWRTRSLSSDRASALAWSPDGKLLGYASDDGIEVVDVMRGSVRVLAAEKGVTRLAWSPDGRWLAYVRTSPTEYSIYATTDLRVVDRRGRARTLVRSGSAYGGVISDVAWTRPPAGTRYRRPEGRSLATVERDGLTARWPIERLAADGGRVAFLACGHAFVWTPARGTVEQAEAQASLSPRCVTPSYHPGLGAYTFALAGDRVVFGLTGGGNTTWWWLGGTVLTPSRPGFTLASGRATTGTPRTDFVSDLVGAGPLLVYSSADEVYRPVPCCRVTTRQEILRVGPTGCPCPVISAEPGPFVPYDVEGGRIAAAGDNAVVILDGQGTRLQTVYVTARTAQLAGNDLVVAVGSELRRYDVATGGLLATWPLAERARLEDVARGLVVYVLDGQVHVLRLADGADRPVAAGTLARFMDGGLVYAAGARLWLVPFDRLPLR